MEANTLSLQPKFVKKVELKKTVTKPKPQNNNIEDEEQMVCDVEQVHGSHQHVRKMMHRFKSHLKHANKQEKPNNRQAIAREEQNELATAPTFALPVATPTARMAPLQKKIQEIAQQQQQEVKKSINQKIQPPMQPKLIIPVAKPMPPISIKNPLTAQKLKSKVMHQKNYEINHGLDLRDPLKLSNQKNTITY
jgi:hypothetical protein